MKRVALHHDASIPPLQGGHPQHAHHCFGGEHHVDPLCQRHHAHGCLSAQVNCENRIPTTVPWSDETLLHREHGEVNLLGYARAGIVKHSCSVSDTLLRPARCLVPTPSMFRWQLFSYA